jgi:uncharacterized protein (DUF885 family)
MRAPLFAFAIVALVACGTPPDVAPAPASPAPPQPGVADVELDPQLDKALAEATAGVTNQALGQLLREHWRWRLEQSPMFATRLGVHTFDSRIEDNSRAAIDARRAMRRQLLARAKGLDSAALDEADGITRALLMEQLESSIASEVCVFEEWTLNPRGNPVTSWNYLPERHKVADLRGAENLLSRYKAIPQSIDNEVVSLKLGAAKGLFATKESMRRVVELMQKQIDQPLDDWPLMSPAKEEHPDFDQASLANFRTDLKRVVGAEIKPAFARYVSYVKSELLPKARPEDKSGLAALPMGESCYRARIAHFTTLPLSAEAIHRIGVSEVARIDRAIEALGKKSLGTASLPETLNKLRSDPSLYFASADEVEKAAQDALDLAKRKMSGFFGVLPKADCTIRRVPDYEAPYTTIAYYRSPHADGSKPGEYFVNVLKPETRPRFEARVLAIHEAIPGHHLQIAISQELTAVPAIRKYGGFTAYVEGWALYTERLGEEMGMYRNDMDRMGMLSFDAWRAGRLVVDTGIHALGWSRSRARKYFEEHSALTMKNIDNEVDRYINWPGQALGYKIGQLEIVKLRAKAEKELGQDFDIKAFHDAVLTSGPLSMPLLRRRIEGHIKATRQAN